jgi:hypothetical protein
MKILEDNGNTLIVADIFDGVPECMRGSDIVFTDVPYNQSLLTNYSLREASVISDKNNMEYNMFVDVLISSIKTVHPKHAFIEVGKENLSTFIEELKNVYKYVTFYNSTYYHNSKNKSYIVHATDVFKQKRFNEIEDLDEELIVKWICENLEFNKISDFCMGKGMVGYYAYRNNKNFSGMDINGERLSHLPKVIDMIDSGKVDSSKMFAKIKIKEEGRDE